MLAYADWYPPADGMNWGAGDATISGKPSMALSALMHSLHNLRLIHAEQMPLLRGLLVSS